MAEISITVSDMLTTPADLAAAENPFAAPADQGRTDHAVRDDGGRTRATEKDDQQPIETSGRRPSDTVELSDEERRLLEELKAADRNARAHEQAHRAVGGQYIRGGPYYRFERGPDGRLYAVTGEVTIDVSEIPDDPEATVKKMVRVRRTALAPRDPSAQDRRVAAQASASEARARAEALRRRFEEARVDGDRAGKKMASVNISDGSGNSSAVGLIINALA
jgi:hypothetical protein